MEHGHPVPEVGGEPGHHLGGQGDLRHQDHAPPAPADHLLEQTDIHGGLAAAGDAVEEGAGGLARVQSLDGGVIDRLLLPGEDNGPRLPLGDLGHPEGLLLRDGDKAAFFQPRDGSGRGAGKIADVAGDAAAGGGQEADHLVPQRRGAPPWLHSGQSLLRAHRQSDTLDHLVGDLPLRRGLAGDQPPAAQLSKHTGGVLAAGELHRLQLRGASVGRQSLQNPALPIIFAAVQSRLPVHSQGEHLPKPVPQPRRQQSFYRVVEGAEVPLPQPQSQLDLVRAQDALVVQHLGQNLQLRAAAFLLPQGQYHTLAGAVAPSEGHCDPGPHLGPLRQGGGDQVVVGLVDGVGRGGHSHQGHLLHVTASPLDFRQHRISAGLPRRKYLSVLYTWTKPGISPPRR